MGVLELKARAQLKIESVAFMVKCVCWLRNEDPSLSVSGRYLTLSYRHLIIKLDHESDKFNSFPELISVNVNFLGFLFLYCNDPREHRSPIWCAFCWWI